MRKRIWHKNDCYKLGRQRILDAIMEEEYDALIVNPGAYTL